MKRPNDPKLSDHWPTVTLGGKENMEQPESNDAAERASGSLERMVRPLLDYAAHAYAWRLTEKKARMVLESGRPTQIVGLVIRDMDTGQTTVIDQSAVMTLHPSQWNEVMHPKRPNMYSAKRGFGLARLGFVLARCIWTAFELVSEALTRNGLA